MNSNLVVVQNRKVAALSGPGVPALVAVSGKEVLRYRVKSPFSISHKSFTGGDALASRAASHHAFGMFVVTEASPDAIRAIFNQEGELSAAIELRRRFPGVTDNAKARECARSIAGWTPLPVQPRPVTQLRPRKDV